MHISTFSEVELMEAAYSKYCLVLLHYKFLIIGGWNNITNT